VNTTAELPFAFGKPLTQGTIKTLPEDFMVEEILGYSLSGDGEHQYLYVEKTGLNTEDLIKALAKTLQKPVKLISCAGLKDRQALTRQWISVHCPGELIDNPEALQGQGWRVLRSDRHLKKLKTGALKANAFTITVRDISHPETLESRLNSIQQKGAPNYFGPQRFGINGQNLEKARHMLLEGYKVRDRFLKGLYLSAARSFLFNLILAHRVENQIWNQAISGDVMQLTGSHSIFKIDTPDEVIRQRIQDFDISPAGPLWGKGRDSATLDSLALQQRVLKPYLPMCQALEAREMEKAWRNLIMPVRDLSYEWQDNSLILRFELAPGSYATSLLRELVS
jgi:tRNA pseudouridine13 synthase